MRVSRSDGNSAVASKGCCAGMPSSIKYEQYKAARHLFFSSMLKYENLFQQLETTKLRRELYIHRLNRWIETRNLTFSPSLISAWRNPGLLPMSPSMMSVRYQRLRYFTPPMFTPSIPRHLDHLHASISLWLISLTRASSSALSMSLRSYRGSHPSMKSNHPCSPRP